MEDLDWTDFPLAVVDPERVHGQPTLGESRLPLQTIEIGYELGQTPEELADDYGASVEDIRAAFGYLSRKMDTRRPFE